MMCRDLVGPPQMLSVGWRVAGPENHAGAHAKTFNGKFAGQGSIICHLGQRKLARLDLLLYC